MPSTTSNRSRFHQLCVVAIFFLFTCTMLLSYYGENDGDLVKVDLSRFKLEPDSRRKGIDFSNCTLPNIDPWNPDILQYTDLDFHETHQWKNYMRTVLVNGTIRIKGTDRFHWVWNCWGRCVYRLNDTHSTFSDWKPDTEVFECDLVHVVCNSFSFFNWNPFVLWNFKPWMFYHWNPFKWYEAIHTQIIPVKRTHPLPTERKYSVYVIVVDSTSHTQSQVVFSKTLHFLKEQFQAVTFSHLNRVGKNSFPNGVPIFLGKSVESYKGHPVEISCCDVYDNYRIIFDEFREQGYRTMYSEDWPSSFYSYSDDPGYNRTILDHTMEPLRRMVHKNEHFLKYLYNSNEFYSKDTTDLLTYFDQYMKAYPGEPKFGGMWSISMSHDYRHTSIALDTMFLKLLANNTEELDNSFVFFMGDHGLRFGWEKFTDTARLEVNNPALTVSLPRDLRNTAMMEMLRKNSKKLQTHYDTHATFVDIAKYQSFKNSAFNDSNLERFEIPGEKGESYLREQKSDRTCKNLPIPPSYCMCEKEVEDLPTDSPKAIQIGKLVIEYINNRHRIELNQAHLCPKWIFSKVISLSARKPEVETGNYDIVVAPSYPYSEAMFEAVVNVDQAGLMEVDSVERRDKYAIRGDCAKFPSSKPFCHCSPFGFIRRYVF